MINVKATIFNTLKTAFDKMRLLGINDTSLLKKIMFLTVLDDIYDWSDYLDDKQSIQKRLQELRTNFILCNPEFDVCRFPFDQHYVNVNTPQTNYTWKRVWDSPEVIVINSAEEDVPQETKPWIPDPSCQITIVYFGENEEIKADPTTGAPLVNLQNLTTCEKMNIYINRETGTLWYLDTCGQWKMFENQGMTDEKVIELIRTHRGKINRTWTDSNIELEILDDQAEANSNLELLTVDDVEEML